MKRVVAVVLLVAVATGCGWVGPRAGSKGTIRAYIVHHGEPAFRQIIEAFERESGIEVNETFSCRSALLRIVKGNQDGDVCVTSGQKHIDEFRAEGLSASPPVRIGEITPIIEVLKGNPKGIRSLADLAKPGVRVVLCFPGGCIGRVADQVLANAKLADKVAPNIVERVRGDRTTAAAVDGKKADACIVWSWATLEVAPDRYEMVPIAPKQNVVDPLGAIVLKTGANRPGAEKFVTHLQTAKARKILADAALASGK